MQAVPIYKIEKYFILSKDYLFGSPKATQPTVETPRLIYNASKQPKATHTQLAPKIIIIFIIVVVIIISSIIK